MRKLHWGVIGAAGIADRRTLPGMMLADNAELVAVMDVNLDIAGRIQAKYGARRAYDRLADMVADDEVEAVYIATPVALHHEQAVAAARAGKHVLIEKPIALTAAQSDGVIAVCQANKVRIGVGLMMRYHVYHQQIRELITSGRLGDVVSMRTLFTCWYPDIPGSWRQSAASAGGGALLDMGIHCIDLLQFLTAGKARRVGALIGTRTFQYDVEDSATILLEMENGAYACVESFFNIPDAAARGRLEVYGTRGSALTVGTIGQVEDGQLDVTISDQAGYDAQQEREASDAVNTEVLFGNLYEKEIRAFGEAVLDNAPLLTDAADSVWAQRVIETAYRAAKEGRMLDVR